MRSLVLYFFIALLPVAPLQAAALDLYAGTVAVADQSVAERDRAMPLALGQVLGKLSGLASFEDRPAVEPALEQASSLAVSFYYRNDPVQLPDGSTVGSLQLVVHFARRQVDELVRTLQLPVWEPERRPVTVWLLVEDDLGRRVMPIELEHDWDEMMQVAADRGMPVLRPEPDADGAYPADIQLLWGGYTEELAEDGPAHALVIAALREGPEWNVRMNLDYGGHLWTWRERGIDLRTLLTAGMNQAIAGIVERASIAADDIRRSIHEITVTGIRNAADYARCLAYLEGRSLVDGIRVVAAAPGRVRLGLELNAVPDHLARALAQDGVLSPTDSAGEYELMNPLPAADPEPASE